MRTEVRGLTLRSDLRSRTGELDAAGLEASPSRPTAAPVVEDARFPRDEHQAVTEDQTPAFAAHGEDGRRSSAPTVWVEGHDVFRQLPGQPAERIGRTWHPPHSSRWATAALVGGAFVPVWNDRSIRVDGLYETRQAAVDAIAAKATPGGESGTVASEPGEQRELEAVRDA